MAEKKYYWLKLPKGFFERKEVKLLRMTEKGELSVLIYQKMLLNALETDGVIYFEHLTETFEEELALALNEDVESVRTVTQFLIKKNLLTSVDDGFYIETFSEMVGKESSSTDRVRNYRQRKKEEMEKTLHETNETLHETNETLHETNETLHVTNCNTEKRREREEKEKSREDKEIDKDKEIDIDTRVDTEVREDATLETIRLKNQQLFNDFVADKTLSKKQREYILGMVNKYNKLITKKNIQGFYNNAMTSIND